MVSASRSRNFASLAGLSLLIPMTSYPSRRSDSSDSLKAQDVFHATLREAAVRAARGVIAAG